MVEGDACRLVVCGLDGDGEVGVVWLLGEATRGSIQINVATSRSHLRLAARK